MDFVKAGSEESWAEVQADIFSFECKGCAKMKGLEVEMERLRLFAALVGRGEVGCANGSGGGTVDDKVWGGDERDARQSSPQLGRRLKGGKVTGWKETGGTEMGKDTGGKETGKATGAKETGRKATESKGTKAAGAQDSQETGGTGDKLMGEKEMDNMLPSDTTEGQNSTEGMLRNYTGIEF